MVFVAPFDAGGGADHEGDEDKGDEYPDEEGRPAEAEAEGEGAECASEEIRSAHDSLVCGDVVHEGTYPGEYHVRNGGSSEGFGEESAEYDDCAGAECWDEPVFPVWEQDSFFVVCPGTECETEGKYGKDAEDSRVEGGHYCGLGKCFWYHDSLSSVILFDSKASCL